ncbi:MAG: LytR/AlgR family response regulator transcription factor [Ginsengibacter sp.]
MSSVKNSKRPIQCIILDDEPIGREIIENFVKQIDFVEIVAVCEDGFEALHILKKDRVDLLITDIEMPKINGLELVRSLSYQPAVIFVTAHDQFAVNSFDLGVVDYLLKPVSFDRLLKAVNRVRSLISNKTEDESANKKQPDYIFIKSDNELKKVMYSDILYIEADKDYVRIYTSHHADKSRGKPAFYTTYSSMKSIEEKLPSKEFVRIHNSFLVPISAIKSVGKNSVSLINGASLPVSQSHKSELLSALNQ